MTSGPLPTRCVILWSVLAISFDSDGIRPCYCSRSQLERHRAPTVTKKADDNTFFVKWSGWDDEWMNGRAGAGESPLGITAVQWARIRMASLVFVAYGERSYASVNSTRESRARPDRRLALLQLSLFCLKLAGPAPCLQLIGGPLAIFTLESQWEPTDPPQPQQPQPTATPATVRL